MEWLTDKRTGTQTGMLFIIGLVMLDIFCLIGMSTRSIGPLTFVLALLTLGSIPVLALIGYQLYGLARSGYDVDPNAVTIQWGPDKQIVPVESIQPETICWLTNLADNGYIDKNGHVFALLKKDIQQNTVRLGFRIEGCLIGFIRKQDITGSDLLTLLF